jgi:hypothetical protein
MNYTNRPIAAYTMAEFESLTSDNADFARGRGKDKKKRKSRAGLYAGIGAGAVGLAGLGAAGMRYGGAELSKRKQLDKLRKARVGADDISSLGDEMAGRGAKGRFDRDVQSLKDMGDRVKNYDYKGAPGRAFDSVKAGGNRAKSAFETIVGNAQSYGAAERGSATGMKGFGKAAIGGLKGISATRAGKIGLGLAAAGTAAGAGYGIYKAMKKGKKK